jgi:hypothetical protein
MSELQTRTWARLDAYEAAHPEHPYSTLLRLRAANPQARSQELAEVLARHTGGPISAASFRRLLHDARRKFAELLRDEHDQPELAGTETAGMYERFTDRARKVMQLANQEAQRFNHEYIGTEHILLGLVKEGSGVVATVLKKLDIDLDKIRLEVEKIVPSRTDMVTMCKLPVGPRAKKVVAYAIEEARSLNHNYVGTEHVLLGLLREQDGVAAQVLMNLGCKLEDVRKEILYVLGQNPVSDEGAADAES